MRAKVYIVGVGESGPASLTSAALHLVETADVLVGTERLLALFPGPAGQRVRLVGRLREAEAPEVEASAGTPGARPVPGGQNHGDRLPETNLISLAERLAATPAEQRTVVLASGDPGFFGIARYLVARLGKERCEIVPNVSSLQLAFARIKESWEDAVLLSVHARLLDGLAGRVRGQRKVAILTDPEHTPAVIARRLLEHGVTNYRAYVCENLGGADERVVEGDLPAIASQEFGPLNVLILLRDDREEPREPIFGLSDDQFVQRRPLRGLITKSEVRAVSLAKLGLREDSVVWDVGAGSGALAVEAGRVARRGWVYAIEKSPADAMIARENVARLSVGNVTLVEGVAPEGLEGFPDPDAVFVGGSGGRLEAILAGACRRLRTGGRVVANAATLENLHLAVESLRGQGLEVEVALVSVARSRPVGELTRLEPLDPVFVVTGRKMDHGA